MFADIGLPDRRQRRSARHVKGAALLKPILAQSDQKTSPEGFFERSDFQLEPVACGLTMAGDMIEHWARRKRCEPESGRA
jgi:hypothetical protein